MSGYSYSFLNFHGLGNPGHGIEAAERPYWVEPAFFEAVVKRAAERKFNGPVAFTLDDGNASDLDIAAPILLRYGLGADMYVLTGRIGRPGSLSESAIKELAKNGFRIGSHGHAHVDWRKLNRQDQYKEWRESKAVLETMTGSVVTTTAVPFGAYNRSVLTGLRKAGYKAVFTSDRGFGDSSAPIIARTSVSDTMTMADIERIVADNFPLTAKARRRIGILKRKYWL
jgi:peptidoglycan/xylan/chitin deacetylase (PgdA/CDA1 family)